MIAKPAGIWRACSLNLKARRSDLSRDISGLCSIPAPGHLLQSYHLVCPIPSPALSSLVTVPIVTLVLCLPGWRLINGIYHVPSHGTPHQVPGEQENWRRRSPCPPGTLGLAEEETALAGTARVQIGWQICHLWLWHPEVSIWAFLQHFM